MKCKFPEQTRDIVEIEYHKEILANFPKYGNFWEIFVGVHKGQTLEPYGLKFPNNYPNQKEINEIYEKICMMHYSCFVNLACAHYYLANIVNNKFKEETKHFDLFRNFDSAYLHIGAAWQELKLLWENIIYNLIESQLQDKEKENFFFEYLKNKNSKLYSRLMKFQKDVVEYRNSIAHFSRVASKIMNGEHQVPKFIKENTPWRQQLLCDFVSSREKLENDLSQTEKFFNVLHMFMIPKFEEAIEKEKIKIDYDSGIEYDPCSKCKWQLEEVENVLGNQNRSFLASGSIEESPKSDPVVASGIENIYDTNTMDADYSSLEYETQQYAGQKKCSNSKCSTNGDSNAGG